MYRLACLLLCIAVSTEHAVGQRVGMNLLLNTPPTPGVLAQIECCAQVLDVIPEINAVIVSANARNLTAIRALPCVLAADVDAACRTTGVSGRTTGTCMSSDFAGGSNTWNLDAINVTDAGTTRTVAYDGAGVYVAVIDSGLQPNWRDFFPAERIATEHARAFGGGGGTRGTVTSLPQNWEQDPFGHGTSVTSTLLGFSYYGVQDFNGVAPRAKIIPVKVFGEPNEAPYSRFTRAIVYVTSLKASGALGSAPVVINGSYGTTTPDAVHRAAIDAAIAQGIIVVISAGNEGAGGMEYPGAYPEVISVGATGWIHQLPLDDPSGIWWLLRDVPEGDPSQHFLAPFSSLELLDQDLDVLAPGFAVPGPAARLGVVDYTFWGGTSASCPHVAGIAALMLQKNPTLTQGTVEAILESTALPISPACSTFNFPVLGPGNEPTWSDQSNLSFIPLTHCFPANAVGHGLAQADAALAATPHP